MELREIFGFFTKVSISIDGNLDGIIVLFHSSDVRLILNELDL